MSLVVVEKIGEQDYDSLFYVQYTAFSNEPAILALYPGGLDPSVRAQNVERYKTGLGFTDPNVFAAKVVDDTSGEICAFLTMRVYDKSPFINRNDSDVRFPHVDAKLRPWLEWFFNSKYDRKRQMKALQTPGSCAGLLDQTIIFTRYKGYAYNRADLVALGTHPAHQREGAAALLLKSALNFADKKGLMVYLDASTAAAGYGLYEKRGFRVVDTHTYVDKERFPDAPVITLVTMIRDPIRLSEFN